MEQSLSQFRRELSINEDGEAKFGSYLSYIKSKYSKGNSSEESELMKEWKKEYEISHLHKLTGQEKLDINSELADSQSPSTTIIGEEEAIIDDLPLDSVKHSGCFIGSPSPVLYDNFVEENSGDNEIGSYVPSMLEVSDGNESLELPSSISSLIPNVDQCQLSTEIPSEILQDPVAKGGQTSDEIEDIIQDDDDDKENDYEQSESYESKAISHEEDDGDSENGDDFSAEHLPPRILEALNEMRNGARDSLPSKGSPLKDNNSDRPVGSIEVSDVYDFEEIEEI